MPFFRETGPVAPGIYLIDTHIWRIAKQNAVYIIKSSGKAVLIDTGVRKTLKTIFNALHNFKITNLDYILITHSHLDHSGAVHRFARRFPEAVIGFPHLARDVLDRYQQKAMKYKLTNPTVELKEGSIIDLGANYKLEVLDSPGHDPDHIAFYYPSQRVLFVGDACGAHHLGADFSRPTAYAPDFQHEEYLKSLLRFRDIDPAGLAIASYGFATNEEARNCIETAIEDFHHWKKVVTEAMAENPAEDYVANVLLKKFGRSPGEVADNRPERWVKGIMQGLARGFMHSLQST